MAKKQKEKKPRNVVFLTAYEANGEVVLEQTLSLEDYYEELHKLVDDSHFRKEQGIVRLIGKIYDFQGKLVQEFETKYSTSTGDYLHNKARFEDGTVTED